MHFPSDIICAVVVVATGLLWRFAWRLLLPPVGLRDIPTVPIWPLLYSYVSGEVEEQRIRRIMLPFATRHGTDVILVWLFGEWQVHLLDGKIAKSVFDSRSLRKQQPPEHMLFWRLTGRENIFFSDGDQWRKHSRIFRAALQRTTPIAHFIATTRKLFLILGDGGRVTWSDITHRFTLDVVGTTVLGHDFEALDRPDGSFVMQYHDVMTAISDPIYIFLPMLERLVPRHAVRRKVDDLVDRFRQLLARKRFEPGDDVITYMYEEPDMTEKELKDNVVVLFMGGHDTTAGGLSSIIYYLGLYPDVQARVRKEVLAAVGTDAELTVADFARMPFLTAVIRESIRMNVPANVTIPRVADTPLNAGPYVLPPSTPVVVNMCGILRNPRKWENADRFEPNRFMEEQEAASEGHWLPFACGPHQCPARSFALYEQRTLTAMMVREYHWEVPAESIHRASIRNAFSPFSLSLPYGLDIIFYRL